MAPFRAHIEIGAYPQATLTFGQCALGLVQFKAAGLEQVIRPARLTKQAPSREATITALISKWLCNHGDFSPDDKKENNKYNQYNAIQGVFTAEQQLY